MKKEDIKSFGIELQKLSALSDLDGYGKERSISRLRSSGMGALNVAPHFATFGAVVPVVNAMFSKQPMFTKKLLKGTGKGALVLGTAGALVGAARGALFPKGRKSFSVKDGKVKSERAALGT